MTWKRTEKELSCNVITPDGMNLSIWSRAGEPTSATLTATAPAASFGQPAGVGAGAGVDATRAVGALVSFPEPLALLATTRTRSVLPTSDVRTWNVVAVAPLTSWHASPLAPQTSHWYWNVIGCEPLHPPGAVVRVLPAETSPLIVGAEALEGAAVDVLVTADAAEAATRTATAANTGARRKRFMVETSVAGCPENSRGISDQNAVLRTVHRLLQSVHRREAGRQQDAAVGEDRHRLVEAEARCPLGPRLPHREGGSGVGVGGRELGADDRHREHADRRVAGVRIHDVLT